MYQNKLTIYNRVADYRAEDPLLREEATKIIGQAYMILQFSGTSSQTSCVFNDSATFDPTLAPFIASTCKAGIFKGSNGLFWAQKPLTKAEALTVLIRILEGKSSSEAFSPWRTLYFTKAKGIFLTQETEIMSLDRPITRGEIALLIYRFKKMVLSQELNTAMKTQLATINNNPQAFLTTGTTAESGTTPQSPAPSNDIIGLVAGSGLDSTSSLSIINSPEVNEAIQRMYDHKLTSASTISNYQPFSVLTREQAAKMFAQFAKALNYKQLSGSVSSCSFKDLNKSDINLRTSINEVCNLGLMQGNNGNFDPQIPMTKAQFITMIIRLSEGKRLDESGHPRRTAYFQKAREIGILNNGDIPSFELPITRYEAALLFYRFQVKQKITSHLNTETLKNELISTKRTSDGSFASGDIEGSYAVAFDVNLLKNQFFQAGFVELLGTRYELKKTSMTVFDIGDESFVRYGDLVDMQKETKAWTVSFVVSNGNLIQGTIRLLVGNTWLIKESTTTTARFNLIKG